MKAVLNSRGAALGTIRAGVAGPVPSAQCFSPASRAGSAACARRSGKVGRFDGHGG